MAAYGTQDLAIVPREEATQDVSPLSVETLDDHCAQPRSRRLIAAANEHARRVVAQSGRATLWRTGDGGGQASMSLVRRLRSRACFVRGFRGTFTQRTAPATSWDLDAFISLPRGQETPGDPIARPIAPRPRGLESSRIGIGVGLSRGRQQWKPFMLGSSASTRPPMGWTATSSNHRDGCCRRGRRRSTACWLPAVNAARVDPAIVLRQE